MALLTGAAHRRWRDRKHGDDASEHEIRNRPNPSKLVGLQWTEAYIRFSEKARSCD